MTARSWHECCSIWGGACPPRHPDGLWNEICNPCKVAPRSDRLKRKGRPMRQDPREPLRIEFDTRQCDLSPDTIARLRTGVDALARMVEHFPLCELRVL